MERLRSLLLQRGHRGRLWAAKAIWDHKPELKSPKEALNLLDEIVLAELPLFPPVLWPRQVLEAMGPPPGRCEAGKLKVAVALEVGSTCWNAPDTKVDGRRLCRGCADYFASFVGK